MPKHKSNLLLPGTATPEGARRLQEEMTKRDEIDFRAFQMLRRLNDEGLISHCALRDTLVQGGETKHDARDLASELVEKIEGIMRERIMADHNVLQAAAGRE